MSNRDVSARPNPGAGAGWGSLVVIDRDPVHFDVDPGGAVWTCPDGELYELQRFEFWGTRAGGKADEVSVVITPESGTGSIGRTIKISDTGEFTNADASPLNGCGLISGDLVRAYFSSNGGTGDWIGFRLTLRRQLVHADSVKGPTR